MSRSRPIRKRSKRPSVAERQMALLGPRPAVAPSNEVRARWGLPPLPTCDDAHRRMMAIGEPSVEPGGGRADGAADD